MSNSWKKYPKVIQEKKDYHYLNRQLRHDKLAEFSKGGSYRKMPNGGYGWSYRWTREQAILQYRNNKYDWIKRNFPTEKDWLQYWKNTLLENSFSNLFLNLIKKG